MSRLIVKNIPKWIKEERLKNQFTSVGPLTDCSFKYNKEGIFRKFAFIGYRTPEEAQTAIRRFHNTYLDTQKIQVELAKDFGDVTKPRAWSKYSKESSSYQKKEEEKKPDEDKKKKKEKKKKERTKNPVVEEILGDLKDDPSFKEFLDVHQNVGAKPVWADITGEETSKADKHVPSTVKSNLPFDDDTDEEGEEAQDLEKQPSGMERMDTLEGQEEEDVTKCKVPTAGLSDLDYLKSKVDSSLLSESSDSDDNEPKECPNQKDKKRKKGKKEKENTEDKEALSQNSEQDHSLDNNQQSKKKKGKKKKDKKEDEEYSKTDNKKENEVMDDLEGKVEEEQDEMEADNETTGKDASDNTTIEKIDAITDVIHILKVKGIPPSSGEKTVREFFHPIKMVSLRMPKNAKNNSVGIAYVGFKCEEDVLKALGRNKNFIGGKRIFVNRYKVENVENKNQEKPRPWENKKDEAGQTEDIADTGRLYLRNLSYTCTEEDLEKTFSKFGPLVEVHLPVDYLTKKVKGFAFITYMIPEHAVKAFTEMDGKVYQGRMLHVLPGKEKIEEEDQTDEKSSFKKQKQQKQKILAGSSHNWNTLFLGANTVADVMVDKYQTAKSDILDNNVKGSLGVRMALGETQIVSETRDFLIKNGVSLDSFSQANAPRSKSVLLVKNLPAGTKVSEIQTLFSKHGALGRVVLPPSGVTAIVEYMVPTEAKLAFRRLAYSKFHHIPLYLEWAPVEVFTSQTLPTAETTPSTQATPTTQTTPPEDNDRDMKDAVEEKTKKELEMKEDAVKNDNEDDDDADEPGSVLFVKNLNFDTEEDSLKQLFEKCAKVRSASVSKKKDLKNPGKMLSLGYGFVEFKYPDGAMRVLQKMQHTELDGHTLELKISNKITLRPKGQEKRKKQKETKQKTTKILVRNIPFEAKQHELVELFKVFGEIKSVRLPKKLSGTGSHRGFGFVDFLTLHDAKRAFEALCHSTHLYGRRLVLEWANTDDDIDEIRKRTAENYNEGGGKKKKFSKSGLVESLEGSLAGEMGL